MMGLTDLDQIKFEVKNIYEYYAHWIREGKLKVNSDWNKDLKIKFTVRDPCRIVRKSFGDPIAEDLLSCADS